MCSLFHLVQNEELACLPVGTEVSAKYKGAFCEAKVKKVMRQVKCRVTFKQVNSPTHCFSLQTLYLNMDLIIFISLRTLGTLSVSFILIDNIFLLIFIILLELNNFVTVTGSLSKLGYNFFELLTLLQHLHIFHCFSFFVLISPILPNTVCSLFFCRAWAASHYAIP